MGGRKSPTTQCFLLRDQTPLSVSPSSQRVWKMPTHDPSLSLLKSKRHICLLSAFISQRASDSFGKLKAHVYSCWGTGHYCAIYRSSATQTAPCGRENCQGDGLVTQCFSVWSLCSQFSEWRGHCPGPLESPPSLPSLDHNRLSLLANLSGWGSQSKHVWERVAAGKEREAHGLLVSGNKWHLCSNSKSLGHKMKSIPAVFGMAPSDSNTILTLGFSPPPNLISSGFSNNTEGECNVNLPYWAFIKPHSRLKSENSLDLVLDLFFFFFFSSILPKFTAKPWQFNVSASVGVRKRCLLGRSGLLENFLQSKTYKT